MQARICLSHSFFKPEHAILKLFIYLPLCIWIIWIRMMAIEKLNDMKPTTIHIKVDVPFFKIWRYRLPYNHFRMHFFHFTPCCIANPLAMNMYDELEPVLRERVEDVVLNRRPDAAERLLEIAETAKGAVFIK